jgi:hypothetical protein
MGLAPVRERERERDRKREKERERERELEIVRELFTILSELETARFPIPPQSNWKRKRSVLRVGKASVPGKAAVYNSS